MGLRWFSGCHGHLAHAVLTTDIIVNEAPASMAPCPQRLRESVALCVSPHGHYPSRETEQGDGIFVTSQGEGRIGLLGQDLWLTEWFVRRQGFGTRPFFGGMVRPWALYLQGSVGVLEGMTGEQGTVLPTSVQNRATVTMQRPAMLGSSREARQVRARRFRLLPKPSLWSYRHQAGEKPPLAEEGQPTHRLSKARASTLTCKRGNYTVRRIAANGAILQLELLRAILFPSSPVGWPRAPFRSGEA